MNISLAAEKLTNKDVANHRNILYPGAGGFGDPADCPHALEIPIQDCGA